jgi:hypothetical protein
MFRIWIVRSSTLLPQANRRLENRQHKLGRDLRSINVA